MRKKTCTLQELKKLNFSCWDNIEKIYVLIIVVCALSIHAKIEITITDHILILRVYVNI